MQEILNALPFTADAIGLSLATVAATGILIALKGVFRLLGKLAQKTPTAIDDKIVDEAKDSLKKRIGEL